jgi:hypothetical protein
MKHLITHFFICLFIITANTSVFSQQSKTVLNDQITTELSNDYKELESQRLQLISEMYGMMYEISGLFTELERSESLEQLLAEAEKYQKDTLTKSQKKYIHHLEDIKSRIINPQLQHIEGKNAQDIKTMSVTEGFRRIIENKVQEVLKKTDQLSGIGAKVTELNNTSYVNQNFKKQISWSFAFLVGLVIVGFFIVAYKDEKVRKSIFSGDAGLQFITIFSIIIAIILFGITEVLGGKEISALIGGISGYILGRSSLNKSKKKA